MTLILRFYFVSWHSNLVTFLIRQMQRLTNLQVESENSFPVNFNKSGIIQIMFIIIGFNHVGFDHIDTVKI
jgi:hypothetical protein